MSSEFNEPFDIVAEQRDRLAIATWRAKKQYPVILFTECYTYFGERVHLVRVTQEYVDEHMEVVVENGSSERGLVPFKEVTWLFGRRVSQWIRETGCVDVWSQYPL